MEMLRGGVDLGGTKIQAVVVDPQHRVLGQARLPTPKDGGPPGVAQAIAQALDEAAASAGVAVTELAGIGVGSPGAIDDAEGTVTQAPNVTPEWTGSFPLASAVSELTGDRPVRLGNDVDVATWAEFELGAARDYSSILGVFWGTGVGGGVILDGRQWNGRGAAGEIGHVVVRVGGARCGCGRRGCMEAYAGRRSMEMHARRLVEKGQETALFDIMEKRGRASLSSGVWSRALDRDDMMARQLIDRAIGALSAGVASTVNLLDVEAVIIGGGLGTRLGEAYVDRIAEGMQQHLFRDDRPPAVHLAALGDLGGALGGALLLTDPVPVTPA
jgi:glucokinase